MKMLALTVAILSSIGLNFLVSPSSSAITTVPTAPPLTDGPFIISAYSGEGSSLRYMQIVNTSKSLASLDGWYVQTNAGQSTWHTDPLHGYVEPGKKVTLAQTSALSGATFILEAEVPHAPPIDVLTLMPPAGSQFAAHSVQSKLCSSATAPTIEPYYFMRNISSATGNYLSSFASCTEPPHTLESDPLYVPSSPLHVGLQIVEVYPNARDCSPANDTALCYEYVKLYNPTGSPITLDTYRLRSGATSQSATASNTRELTGMLPAGEYAVFRQTLSDSGSNVWLEDSYGIEVYKQTAITYPSSTGHEGQSWAYNETSGAWQWSDYPTPANQANRFGEQRDNNMCIGLQLSEIGAHLTQQFIEVYNANTQPLPIAGCQLQTNRSQTFRVVFADNITLAAGEYYAVAIEGTKLTLSKTTTGEVYLVDAAGTTEIDTVAYPALASDTSFARIGDTWQQTYTPTAGRANTAQPHKPCETGYERSLDTGRCNKIATTTSAVKACKTGYYRSAETNRCRKIVTVQSTLTPCKLGYYRNPTTNRCRKTVTSSTTLTSCKSGYYRNPATNRCKKIATTSSTLTPCKTGYERNPETNRCRKLRSNGTLASASDIPYPVETTEAHTGNIIGWWIFGGILLAGTGYATWEWRSEIRRLLSRRQS